MISYVEAMIKISEDFVHVVTYDAYKPGHLYMRDETQILKNRKHFNTMSDEDNFYM